ncbi:3-hydroxyacyl-CoA dehydrogenase [Desulfitispora alkaliphila]|uniref:3-hydroxyacyl-CoA dehydrogenase/enoyl-CoA hydratase family protein n=1 Tax=Desulfitispora alkaliphila TaxID=622674 RepID=UPI003D2074A0
MRKIKTAAVLGAGVMGATIAAHLANVGIKCYLLDIVPNSLTPEEEKKGLTLEDPAVRNRLAQNGLKNIMKAKPAAFYSKVNAELVTVGNMEDNFDWLSECDWIVEVVIERLDIKQSLYSRIADVKKEDAIISSNTSGLSINKMVEHLPDEFQENFLGTHFFNPPRYMKLLELIPTEKTKPELLEYMREFSENVLGKGVVFAKDTPNFIANRIGIFGMLTTIKSMIAKDYSIDEIEKITGPALGRPKSASFRTLDLVGLDTFAHVAKNVQDNVQDEKEKETFTVPQFVLDMIEKGWLGQKSKQGFFQKVKKDGKSEILTLDYKTLEYKPKEKVGFPSLEAAKNAKTPGDSIKAVVYAKDRAGEFAWDNIKNVLLYSAKLLPGISDSIVDVDNAMKWGFNWKLGPFETWDAIGLEKSVEKMKSEGEEIPQVVEDLLAKGYKSFYKETEQGREFFDFKSKEYKPVDVSPREINLKKVKKANGVVKSNAGASLIDLGDNVYCLEFHSHSNAIGADILSMINYSVDYVEQNGMGLVVANQGKNFSVGANLMMILMEAQDQYFDEIDLMIRHFQKALMNLKYCEKPVVAAPHAMALGGGCEVVLHSHKATPAAESYLGLVELGVGVIPAGGGTKEMALRASEQAGDKKVDLQPFINKAFETVAMGKVATSAQEAKEMGFIRETDRVVVNTDHVIYQAKQTVLAMDTQGFEPFKPKPIRVVGEAGLAVLRLATYSMKEAGYISEYDQYLANQFGYVLTGGNVPANTLVSEEYLLDLEREVFVKLCAETKTQERMQYMLSKGKPLRN